MPAGLLGGSPLPCCKQQHAGAGWEAVRLTGRGRTGAQYRDPAWSQTKPGVLMVGASASGHKSGCEQQEKTGKGMHHNPGSGHRRGLPGNLAHVRGVHIAQEAEAGAILQPRGVQLLVQLHSVPAQVGQPGLSSQCAVESTSILCSGRVRTWALVQRRAVRLWCAHSWPWPAAPCAASQPVRTKLVCRATM